MEISIRIADMNDVPTLKELIPLSARELSKGFYTPEQAANAIKLIFGVDTKLSDSGLKYLSTDLWLS